MANYCGFKSDVENYLKLYYLMPTRDNQCLDNTNEFYSSKVEEERLSRSAKAVTALSRRSRHQPPAQEIYTRQSYVSRQEFPKVAVPVTEITWTVDDGKTPDSKMKSAGYRHCVAESKNRSTILPTIQSELQVRSANNNRYGGLWKTSSLQTNHLPDLYHKRNY